MFHKITFGIFFLTLINYIFAGGSQAEPAPTFRFILDAAYDQCEGEEAYNYTGIVTFNTDVRCTLPSIDYGSGADDDDVLVACTQHGQRRVNALVTLARSIEPQGAYYQVTTLSLVTAGNLEGRYVLRREQILDLDYIEKCSSRLGLNYVSTKSVALLVARKFDIQVFLNAGDPLEVFRKGASTICTGKAYVF